MNVKMEFVAVLIDDYLEAEYNYQQFNRQMRKAIGANDSDLVEIDFLPVDLRCEYIRYDRARYHSEHALFTFCACAGIDMWALVSFYKSLRRAERWDLMYCYLDKYAESIYKLCKA